MKVVLLYPPPWKLAAPGEVAELGGDGAPGDFHPSHLDGDFFQMPYGVLSLAAQLVRAGHEAKVLNLSAYAWSQVERIVSEVEAELWGLSCFTANRRGVALVAACIKRHHPSTRVIVGGPHATALPSEMLSHHAAIDAVVIGEGEATLLDVVQRLSSKQSFDNVPGLAWRVGGSVRVSERRHRLKDLDSLASPHDLYDTHVVVTSRGCPGRCTFCATKSVWGKAYRVHSVERVIGMLEKAVGRVPTKMLTLKDETFSASRTRARAICEGIVARGLRFVWSCDTRADSIDEGLVRAMRLAGCQRLSLGVESGSAEVLRGIGKNVTPERILETTRLAKKYGLPVRYFMMMGNRGETADRFKESLAFLEAAQPHHYVFACLSVYPGTPDFEELERRGWIDREAYFSGDFQELKMPFDASEADTQMMGAWFERNRGVRTMFQEGVTEYAAILERLGDFAGAHLDLGGAYYREGNWDAAELHVRKALALAHPLPGLLYNYLACIAFARGDVELMKTHFEAAMQDPLHPVLMRNVQAVRAWLQQGGPAKRLPLRLDARHDFELFDRAVQPSLPGPLPRDWARWAR